ncbi:MAG: type II toxin-antitoxin system VapC family toxin [Proteobacteria bacterium]|nr:type II toxin-antitoxin system VapC family toxin [Pseudomonadota bacterium]MBU1570469.1 type II toxin-antitoxin system VapC family toxin [Pseudomonadota bacterium]
MKYLLDTNICIYVINESPRKVLKKFAQHPVSEFGISSITHAELQYGVEKSKNKNQNQSALDEFLLPLTILPFHGQRLVACYGEIRALLESEGKTIGPLDMLIAAHALTLNLTIVSNNIKEFSRIPNLKYENWT